MNAPRGAVTVNGVMSREWRRFFEIEGAAFELSPPPRTDPRDPLPREWRRWLDGFGPSAPKEGLMDADGNASRAWRRYLEEL